MVQKQDLIEEYKSMITLCKEYHLDEYVEKLDSKMRSLEEPLRFMIVGEGKSGKSTLLNALVGDDVAEVDDMPKTWCINAYYNEEGESFAELIYPEHVQRVSIKEAKEVSARIGSRSRKGNKKGRILESDYRLREIRWHLPLRWPGENIVMIDTPGLGQDRADTYCEKISIDSAEGIQYEAEDGFETFQYKADLLLWCFNAENTGDEVVERKLQKVSVDAGKIYGIVTRLDEHEEEDRERLFQNCERHYRKYVKQCLRSSLPSLEDADSPEEAEEMLRMRKETVDSIRWCIEYLLKDNDTLEVIKLESSAKYLEGMKQQIAGALKSYLAFYFENYQSYNKVLQSFLKDLEAECERITKEISKVSKRVLGEISSDVHMSRLWLTAGENAEIYAELLTQQMNNSGLLQQLERIGEDYQKVIQELLIYATNNIKWKDILIGLHMDEEVQMKEHKAPYDGKIAVPTLKRVVVHMEDMGLVYRLSQWAEATGFGSLVKALAGGYLRTKAIEMGRDAFTHQLENCENRYKNFVYHLSHLSRTYFTEIIDESFRKQTGQKPEGIEAIIVAIERKMTIWNWYGKEILYYPFVEGDILSFIQAVYLPKLKIFQEQNKEIILGWLEEHILKPVFEEQREMVQKTYRKAFAEYTGTKKIEKPYCDEKIMLISGNKRIQKRLPYIQCIGWGDMQDEVDEKYEAFRSGLEQYCIRQWDLGCAGATKALVKEKGDLLQRYLQKEYLNFSKMWLPQLKNMVEGCKARKEFFRVPPEAEYRYFYQYYYYPLHPAEVTILLLQEYEQTGQVPMVLLQKVQYVSPDGQVMDELFQRILKDVLDRILKQLSDEKGQILKSWDEEVKGILKQITDHYERGFEQLDNVMETTIMPAWKAYQENVANYGNHRIKDAMEYMRKSGKVPKQYLRLAEGNVPLSEIGMAAYCVFSDGKSVYDGFTEWLQERNREFMNKWR